MTSGVWVRTVGLGVRIAGRMVLDDLNVEFPPAAITAVVGPSGSGKTTFSGKLALYLKGKKNLNPLLVAADIYRPAAIDQLHVLGDQVKVPVYSDRENKNAVSIVNAALADGGAAP